MFYTFSPLLRSIIFLQVLLILLSSFSLLYPVIFFLSFFKPVIIWLYSLLSYFFSVTTPYLDLFFSQLLGFFFFLSQTSSGISVSVFKILRAARRKVIRKPRGSSTFFLEEKISPFCFLYLSPFHLLFCSSSSQSSHFSVSSCRFVLYFQILFG